MPTMDDIVGNMGESLVCAEDDQTWNELVEEAVPDDEGAREGADDDIWEVRAS